MSKTIEQEIVALDFDAAKFRAGLRDATKSLEDFKKSFDFYGAQRGMAELERASQIDFSGLERSIQGISGRMSALGIIGATVISNITSSVMSAAGRMFDALIMTPLTTGLEEYETQLNSVQTILANTARYGTTLQDVTTALDELNLYADKTIYNFTQMTESIGKFTTAGVDLDTSVAAIKGIANAAALSGSNAQQASTAMYQLSQAISSGVVRLQDWISVENAGLGGQIFRDSLIETARVYGVAIDDILEDEGGFRNSLATGWLSSEILLETLSKFTGDLTEQQLIAMGYTEEQIAGIIELGQNANDAATKIKTLTQFKDTLLEALQSGWSETWRLVLGDFEQAKELWGTLSDIFGNMISSSSDARNSMIRFWASAGGRDDTINAVINIISALSNILGTLRDGITDIFDPLKAGDLLLISRRFLQFSEALLSASENTAPLRTIIRGIAAALDIAKLAILALLRPIGELLSKLLPLGDDILETSLNVSDAIVAFREFAIETDFFNNVVDDAIAYLADLRDRAKELIREFIELEVVQDLITWFRGITRSDINNVFDGLLVVLKALAAPFVFLALSAKRVYEEFLKFQFVQDIISWIDGITWDGIKSGFSSIADSIGRFFDRIKDSELLAKFVEYLSTFDGRRITAFFAQLRSEFGFLRPILEKIQSLFGDIGGAAASSSGEVSGAFDKIGEVLSSVLDTLIKAAQQIDYGALFDRIFTAIQTTLLAILVATLQKAFRGDYFKEFFEDLTAPDSFLGGLKEQFDSIFGTMESTLTSFQNNIKADSLQKIAIAIAILVGSVALLTFLDTQRLAEAGVILAALATGLFGTSGALGSINTTDALKATIAIIGLSGAMLIAASAMKAISKLDQEELERGITGFALGLGSLVASVRVLTIGGSKDLVKTIGIMLGLVASIRLMVGVVKEFGEMDPETIKQGLAGIALSLVGLITSVLALSRGTGEVNLVGAAGAIIGMSFALNVLADSVLKFGTIDTDALLQGLAASGLALVGFAGFSRLLQPIGLFTASLGILGVSAAMLILAEGVRRFSELSWEELIRGLSGAAGGLAALAIAANFMIEAVPGALAILVMAGALIGLTFSLKALSELSWEGLLIALVAIGGSLLVLGLIAAGLSTTGAIVALAALAGVLLLIGGAAALMGGGIFLAVLGLTALAASGLAVGGVISVVGAAVIALLPSLGSAIAQAFANFINVIAINTPVIMDGFRTIMLGIITTMGNLIPEVIAVVMDIIQAILDAIAERLPDLIDSGYSILISFLTGVRDNMAEVTKLALLIIVEFLDGLEQGVPQLVDKAYSLLLTFINASADAMDAYLPSILAAGARLGDAIADGIILALEGRLADIIASITNIGDSAIAAIKAVLGIESPSKEFGEVAYWTIEGFIGRLKTEGVRAVEELKHFGEKLQNGSKEIAKKVSKTMEEHLRLPTHGQHGQQHGVGRGHGVHTVDTWGLSEGMHTRDGWDSPYPDHVTGWGIARHISGTGHNGAHGHSGHGNNNENIPPNNTTRNGEVLQNGVTFIQNNYSPKPLDAAAIYRQTKSLVSKIKDRAK